MLTVNDYNKGIIVHNQIKYSVVHNNAILFDIVCASLADRLLVHEYSVDLTDEKINRLQKIKNI